MLRKLFWLSAALLISVAFDVATLLLLNLCRPFDAPKAPHVPPSNLSADPYSAPIDGQPPQPNLAVAEVQL